MNDDPRCNPHTGADGSPCEHTTPYCPGCRKQAADITSVARSARDICTTPEMFVRHEEGTYNPDNEHFLCDGCFLVEEAHRGHRLVGPNGTRWVCP